MGINALSNKTEASNQADFGVDLKLLGEEMEYFNDWKKDFDDIIIEGKANTILSEPEISYIKELKSTFEFDIDTIKKGPDGIKHLLKIMKSINIHVVDPILEKKIIRIYFGQAEKVSSLAPLQADFEAKDLQGSDGIRNFIKEFMATNRILESEIPNYVTFESAELVEIDNLLYKLAIDYKSQAIIKESISEIMAQGQKEKGLLKEISAYPRILELREFLMGKFNFVAWNKFANNDVNDDLESDANILTNLSINIAARLLFGGSDYVCKFTDKELSEKIEAMEKQDKGYVESLSNIKKFITRLQLQDKDLLKDLIQTYNTRKPNDDYVRKNIESFIMYSGLKGGEITTDTRDLWDAVKNTTFGKYTKLFEDIK